MITFERNGPCATVGASAFVSPGLVMTSLTDLPAPPGLSSRPPLSANSSQLPEVPRKPVRYARHVLQSAKRPQQRLAVEEHRNSPMGVASCGRLRYCLHSRDGCSSTIDMFS